MNVPTLQETPSPFGDNTVKHHGESLTSKKKDISSSSLNQHLDFDNEWKFNDNIKKMKDSFYKKLNK